MHIGSFFRTPNGYEGIIETATLDIRISIVPAEPSDADKAPDWRVHRGDGGEGPEIGAGWNETGERDGSISGNADLEPEWRNVSDCPRPRY